MNSAVYCAHSMVPCNGACVENYTLMCLLIVLSVTKAEDPEKILEQAVVDMQGDLIKMRQASAQVSLVLPCVKDLLKVLVEI